MKFLIKSYLTVGHVSPPKNSQSCVTRNIKHTLNSTQRPQANGQVERINRFLIPMLTTAVTSGEHQNLNAHLAEVQRCVNWAPSKSARRSPFELLHGYVPSHDGGFPRDLLPEGQYVNPEQLQHEARDNIHQSQLQQKKYYDQRHSLCCK